MDFEKIHCGLERPVTLEGQHLPFFQCFQYHAVRFHPVEYLKNKEYRYLSPVVLTQGKERWVVALHSAAPRGRSFTSLWAVWAL